MLGVPTDDGDVVSCYDPAANLGPDAPARDRLRKGLVRAVAAWLLQRKEGRSDD